jgi:hypothetical protein
MTLIQFSSFFGPVILQRPSDVMAKSMRSQKRPVRIAQELARQNHNVGLAGADDLISLGWIGNHSNSAG